MLRPSGVSGLLARSGRHVRKTGFPNCSPKAEKKYIVTGFPDTPLRSRYRRRGGWDCEEDGEGGSSVEEKLISLSSTVRASRAPGWR